jgi:hypothetical protein
MLEYLDSFIKEQKINKDDICIVGSFVLECAGIRKANDIDIILRENTRRQLGFALDKAIKVNDKVEIVSYGWIIFIGITDDELISNSKYHSFFYGYKIVNLELVKQKKIHTKRIKDIQDLKKLGVPFPSILGIYFLSIFNRLKSGIKIIANNLSS